MIIKNKKFHGTGSEKTNSYYSFYRSANLQCFEIVPIMRTEEMVVYSPHVA